MKRVDLERRMKKYEKASDYKILPGNDYFILRLDGMGFHEFINDHFKYPFDKRFRSLLTRCAIIILERFQGAILGYVQSDEMSLLFKTFQDDDNVPLFNNRIQKITSTAAGITSSYFTAQMLGNPGRIAAFDCRCFTVPTSEIVNYFTWRQHDCFRNAINSLLVHDLKKIKNMDVKDINDLLRGMKLDDRAEMLDGMVKLEEINLHFLHGTIMSKKKYTKETEHGSVTRQRWGFDSIDFETEPEKLQEMIFNNGTR